MVLGQAISEPIRPTAPHASRLPGAPMVSLRLSSPNANSRKVGMRVDTIVLHHTTLATLDETVQFFQDPSSEVSAHYIVGKDGVIVQMVPDAMRAWHAGASSDAHGRTDVNDFSLGIELVNEGDGAHPYPEAQLLALDSLIKALIKKHPIRDIASHEYVADPPGRKHDPIGFPWERLTRFKRKLSFGMKPTPPASPQSN